MCARRENGWERDVRRVEIKRADSCARIRDIVDGRIGRNKQAFLFILIVLDQFSYQFFFFIKV